MELVKYRAVIISVLKGGEEAECRKSEMTLKGGLKDTANRGELAREGSKHPDLILLHPSDLLLRLPVGRIRLKGRRQQLADGVREVSLSWQTTEWRVADWRDQQNQLKVSGIMSKSDTMAQNPEQRHQDSITLVGET